MKRKFIPAEESFARWKKDPEFAAAYDARGAEFALAASLIKARSEADLTQEQVAKADVDWLIRNREAINAGLDEGSAQATRGEGYSSEEAKALLSARYLA